MSGPAMPEWLVNLAGLYGFRFEVEADAPYILRYGVRCVRCDEPVATFCDPEYSDWQEHEYLPALKLYRAQHICEDD